MATNYLKQVIRRNISERRWRQLSHLKKNLSFGGVCASFIKLLPKRSAVRIKEHITLTGKLDYPHSDIYMNLDSSLQIWRLGACMKEPETVEWIENHMRPGDVLYDIGANVGAYSFLAYAVTKGNCKIYSFEPSFSTFAALSQNVFINRCQERVIPLHIALGSETKLFSFNYSSIEPGAALHSLDEFKEEKHPFQPAFTQPIPSYRLDDLVHQFALQPPNHIKLDVDGAELSVLFGAEKMLTQPSLRSLLVEVDEELYPHGEIPSFLKEKKFNIRSKYPRGYSATLFNYIFER